MKIKNALMCGALAAVMLFTGCGKDNAKSGPAEIKGFEGNVKDVSPESGDLIATFEIEDFGTVKAVLFPEAAPVGVENFQKLCDVGYYDGLKIHRVMSGFMMQGGSLNGDGTGGAAMVNGGRFSIETAQNARHFYGALCYANAGADNNTTQFYIVNNKTPQDLDVLAENVSFNIEYFNEAIEYYKEAGVPEYVQVFEQEIEQYQSILDWLTAADDVIKARYAEKGGAPSLDGGYTVFGQVYEGFDVIDAISAVEVEENSSGELSKPVRDIVITSVRVSTLE